MEKEFIVALKVAEILSSDCQCPNDFERIIEIVRKLLEINWSDWLPKQS